MIGPTPHRDLGTGLILLILAASCSSASPTSDETSPRSSDASNAVDSAGGNSPPELTTGAGGSSGIGGEPSSGGGSGGIVLDSSTPSTPDADAVPNDAQKADARPINYEGQIPIYGGGPVGPMILPDCQADPTQGWTEYSDTFHVEHPYDLMVADRFKIEGGIYTFWVYPGDKPHAVGNTTAPRTEARWSNFTSTRPHIWAADVMIESPSNHVTVMQVHTTDTGAGPVYLRVDDGNLHPLNGANFYTGLYDKWFNMKVSFDPTTLESTVYINDCPKQTGTGPRGDGVNYFKNGVYTCTSTICRDHYKNFHLYTKP